MRRLMRWAYERFKLHFVLYDRQDITNAMLTCGNAKDREDFEWKLQQRLTEMRP